MNISVRNAFMILAAINLALIVCVIACLEFFIGAEKKIERDALAKYNAYILADELRQSSDDLTKYARIFAETGDPKFEQQYNDILAIRAGKKPRPQDYHRIYWDLYTVDMKKPRPDGEAVSLEQLMKDAGFSEEEFAYIAEAQANSEGLVKLEIEAMNAVKGIYPDINGNYVVESQPNYNLASQLLFSEEYFRYKADIMRPMDKFIEAMEARVLADLKASEGKGTFMIVTMHVLMGLSTVLLILTGYIILRRVVNPVGELNDSVNEITEQGNLRIDIPHLGAHDEIGRLARSVERFRLKLVEDEERTLADLKAAELEKQKEQAARVEEQQQREREIAISEEIATIINGCRKGDFTQRLATHDKEGVFLNICEGVNDMSDVTQNSLSEIKNAVQSLSAGDLSAGVNGAYEGLFGEMKEALNETIATLRNITQDIRNTAASVNDSAAEISTCSIDLSNRTETQASSLEQTAASMEQITAAVVQNTDSASDLRSYAEESKRAAEDGGQVVKRAVESMGEISSSSSKIADIIGVIDEIAFQINLLALNAAVEAARAGEAGKGFAVVADEVRTLAGRSATASREIQELIQSSVDQVKSGEALVGRAGESLDGIVDSFTTLANKIAGIADASQEQSVGVREVSKAVNSMDKVTQQNASMAEESAASARSLTEMAGTLNELVSFFSTGRGGIANQSANRQRTGTYG